MCELFSLNAHEKIRINEYLQVFISHSNEHRNGWGLAFLDDAPCQIKKEAVKALDSVFLRERLQEDILVSKCIGHIRKATIGDVNDLNSHPFTRLDVTGRQWVLAHNGTIFESDALAPFQYVQEGTTDSERILLYLVSLVNEREKKFSDTSNGLVRIHLVDALIKTLVPGNKVNLMIYDKNYLYVHANEVKTLYQKEVENGMMFATKSLDEETWTEVPINQLFVYQDGKLVYIGQKHEHTYVHDEEKMRLLSLAYAGL